MKKTIFAWFLVVSLVYALYFLMSYSKAHLDDPYVPNHTASLQAKSSHMLKIMQGDIPIGQCTGTAIGPHAILTAAHCKEGDRVQIDLATHPYKIKKVLSDDRDHAIFLVDGPAFYDVQPYEVRYPKVGEPVHIYGFGGSHYPVMDKAGKVLDEYDPSEANHAAGLFYTTVPAIPGDSGAAVYGEDGKIISTVTYGIKHKDDIYERQRMAGFALNFTPKQIKEAQNF